MITRSQHGHRFGRWLARQNKLLVARGASVRALSREYTGVYFLSWNGYIKIGHATDVVRRARAIYLAIPEGDVTPLAWIPIPMGLTSTFYAGDHEHKIHQVLDAYRVRGEWFRDCPAVRRFIDRYGTEWPIA